MRTLILGSCVTRDAFEFQPDDKPLEIAGYFARSGLASSMHPIPFTGVDVESVASPFQRRVVAWDLAGGARDAVLAGEYDVLVLDLIDERFDLLENAAGARATRSPEFAGADYDHAADTLIPSGSDAAFERWEGGWVELVRILRAAGRLEDLRVNRVRWAATVRGGGDFPAIYGPDKIAAGNAQLDRMYARMGQDLPARQFWDFTDAELDAAAEHKWGVGPFHYVDDYYHRLVGHLLAERARRQGGSAGGRSRWTAWARRGRRTTR
jgi:hypothetical protein